MVRITEIIIPCFNEEKRIVKTIGKLKKLRPGYRVLFIDDGSTDLTTNVIIKEIDGCENMRLITLKKNQGKWGAVRAGALNVVGDICILSDADLSVDLPNIYFITDFFLLSMILNKDYVVVGNRFSGWNKMPFKRWFFSRAFNLCVRIAGVDSVDSQSPCKCWRNSKRMYDIFASMKERGFAGDVEFLKRCKLGNVPVVYLDVRYDYLDGSTVNIKKHAPKMFAALWRINKNVKPN